MCCFFAERALDNWFKKGDVQDAGDKRMHSLSDAIAFMGMSSEPNVITGFDPENLQIRNEEKDQTFTMKPNKDIEVVTGAVEFKMFNGSDTIDIVAPTKINIDTPLAQFTTDVKIDGKLEVDQATALNSTLDVLGDTALSDTVTSNSKDISDTHKHSGVTSGGSVSGVPV